MQTRLRDRTWMQDQRDISLGQKAFSCDVADARRRHVADVLLFVRRESFDSETRKERRKLE